MSEKVEKTLAFFKEGANCAQAIACTFCEEYGVSKQDMMRLTSTLGGGMCDGEICGVASGAMLIIALKHGPTVVEDKSAKFASKEKGREFMLRFAETCGHVRCEDFLGHNINTPEGLAKGKPIIQLKCKNTLASAVQILEEMGY